ncbi:hypothetical protein IV203_024844 [Nitzschia inconspicua]|uniref:Cyclin C-terminal domain-containing protein n=1 Tax=Nitzschia inconspicua TaxID=303405 RepID=A0A9K3P6V8_9STRA|nr:hypothetical protein IV203_024844 [Nitzschia inconspicua]
MEKIIVETCKWYMNPPTANQIGHELVLWMCGQDNIVPFDTLLDLVNLQVEAAVYDYYLVTAAPSLVAVAAFLNAVEGMGVHTPQEQRRIRNKVISTIEMSRSESQLLPKVQQRLYELISDSFTFSFDHETISQPLVVPRCRPPMRISTLAAARRLDQFLPTQYLSPKVPFNLSPKSPPIGIFPIRPRL